MKILLTGGLGYIGSHIAHLLGSNAVIIDNKSNSKLNYKKKLPLAKVYISKISEYSLKKIFSENDIDGVIHLASLKSVNESNQKPLNYYRNNFISSLILLQTMEKFNIKKLIFSSSATVYGNKFKSPFNEEMPLSSTNPYGNTKIAVENLIKDFCESQKNFRALSLRYFNPLGANVDANLSERPIGEPKNIMPILINSVIQNKFFYIFGNDYDTKDGTCIRDFIHVKDLSYAHILSLKKISKVKKFDAINLGLGRGISVLELIKIFEKTNKIKIKYKFKGRRNGDIAVNFASNKKSIKFLNWKPSLNYNDMVKDAWLSYQNKI